MSTLSVLKVGASHLGPVALSASVAAFTVAVVGMNRTKFDAQAPNPTITVTRSPAAGHSSKPHPRPKSKDHRAPNPAPTQAPDPSVLADGGHPRNQAPVVTHHTSHPAVTRPQPPEAIAPQPPTSPTDQPTIESCDVGLSVLVVDACVNLGGNR